jgi:small-conductance mechanosensitive channel
MFANVLPFFQKFLIAILIAVVGWAVAYGVYHLVRKILEKPLGKTWSKFLGRLVALGFIIYAVKLILDQTGAAGVFVILATAITGALAIGSQGLAADLVGALIIFFTRPFQAGDYISVGDYEGEVEHIGLVSTVLCSFDGSRVVLRNADVIDNTIVNMSANPAMRIEVNVPVPLSADLEKATQVLYECLKDYEPRMPDQDWPAHVVFDTVLEDQAQFQIRMYIPSSESFGMSRMKLFVHATKALKKAAILQGG